MKIGELQIDKCNECPAFTWAGESSRTGDAGCYCRYGAFSNVPTGENKSIPTNCPLMPADKTIKSPNA